MKKVTALTLLALLVAAGGGLWWYAKDRRVDPLADVITVRATKSDIEEAVLASGTLRPAKLVAVGAQVSGRIMSLNASIGKILRKGDLVAQIDDLSQRNALKTAEASLAASRAQLSEKQASLAYAKSTLERESVSLASKASSRDAYESKQSTVKMTEAQIDALEAQIAEAEVAVATARVNIGYTRITAPMDGTVLLVTAQEGQTVNAAQSAPTIIVMGQVDRMMVETEISEADIPKVKPGQPVYFTILGDREKRWHAMLTSVDPAPDSLRSDAALTTSATSSSTASSSSSSSEAVYYYGRFEVPNPEGILRTYMTAEVRIVLGSAKGVIAVPTSALLNVKADGKAEVEVVNADKSITLRRVETGLNDKIRIEIRSGLSEGDLVVTNRKSANFVSERPRGPMGL